MNCETTLAPAIDVPGLTARIVAAYAGANTVEAAELPGLVTSVGAAIAGLGQPEPDPAPEPSVPVNKSVKPDAITCLHCGKGFKMLQRHLRTDHGVDPDEYRAQFNLPASYPMTAPEYSARRRDLALEIGLGRKPGGK